MNINQIKENFIIVSTLNRQYPILMCRDKQTADYKFFKIDGNKFTDVDKQTEIELKKIYKGTRPDVLYFNSYFYNKQAEFEIRNHFLTAKQIINDFIKDLQPELQKTINNLLDSVKIEVDLKELNEEKPAFYKMKHHSIVVNYLPRNKFEALYVLVHELLHAATSNLDGTESGLSKSITTKSNTSEMGVVNFVGVGFNEAVTDYYAYNLVADYVASTQVKNDESLDFINKIFISGYDFVCNIYDNLLQYLDEKQVLQYYFNHDLDSFLTYSKNVFNYTDHDDFLALVYKCDAHVEMVSYSQTALVGDYVSIMLNTYLSFAQMIKHKIKTEGEYFDKSQIKFDTFRFPLYGEQRKLFFESLKNLINKLNTSKDSVITRNLLNDALGISAIFCFAYEKKPFILLDKFANSEFIFKAFCHNVYVFEDQTKPMSLEQMEDCFKWLFSNKNQAFEDYDKKIETMMYLIAEHNRIPFNFVQLFEPKDLAYMLNKAPKFTNKIIELSGVTLDNCFVFLSDEVLGSIEVQNHVYKTCKFLIYCKVDYKKYLQGYTRCFEDKNLGDIILNNTEFCLNSELSTKPQNESKNTTEVTDSHQI